MMQEIIEAPGKVWLYLSSAGESSISKIKKDTKMPDSLIYIGVGWLAKEGKVYVRRDGGSIKVSLK
ncbi:MAG: winged helix-turn-helix domain-containing protein [Candidatus Firestonebacteria bacterium]